MSLSKSQTLRTFVELDRDHFEGRIPHHISKLKYLRVLDSSFVPIRNLSSLIGNLKHLRYLHIWFSDVKTIPKSITSLQNLQVLNVCGCLNLYKLPESVTNLQNLRTLDVSCCFKLGKLPKQMSKMKNIRHLKNSDTDSLTCMPRGIGQLTHLQTLERFIVGKEYGHHIGELQKLNLRGELSIEDLNCVRDAKDAEEAKLMSKPHLCSLNLLWNPTEISTLPNGIENLRTLQRLTIRTLPKLVSLPDELQYVTSLQQLSLSYCDSLVGMPEWIENLTALQYLRIFNCPNIVSLPAGLKRRAPPLNMYIEDALKDPKLGSSKEMKRSRLSLQKSNRDAHHLAIVCGSSPWDLE
ncbi:putative disease resistance protein RGA3 [Cinnamomum micranthum f. kanehirae]|uniref:Putative disease resistance protein RGA3 n=1 Tax=Cinnamomum micranthum f. kanehirae TaxID=337451 RepID=A0A443NYJ4_9MAGN|nr:putative disease resistance protein RGA3 [Cinnamomum micranthum f. kanehirae]